MISDSINKIENPVKKFLKWKDDGFFTYWDKEKSMDVQVPLPIRFVALDSLHTITGWYDPDSCGIYSNEIKSTLSQRMTVKTWGNKKTNKQSKTLAEGLYGQIKGELKGLGGEYTISLYALMGKELVNFQLKGAARAGFFSAPRSSAYEVSEFEEMKNGKVTYNQPVFKPIDISDATRESAEIVYKEVLKPYLDDYLSRTQSLDKEVVKEKNVSNFAGPIDKKATAEDFEFEPTDNDKFSDLPF